MSSAVMSNNVLSHHNTTKKKKYAYSMLKSIIYLDFFIAGSLFRFVIFIAAAVGSSWAASATHSKQSPTNATYVTTTLWQEQHLPRAWPRTGTGSWPRPRPGPRGAAWRATASRSRSRSGMWARRCASARPIGRYTPRVGCIPRKITTFGIRHCHSQRT